MDTSGHTGKADLGGPQLHQISLIDKDKLAERGSNPTIHPTGEQSQAPSDSTTPAWRDEFIGAGFKPYRDSFKDRDERHTPVDRRMYAGSAQRRVRDGRGTRYFLNVDFYDFTMHDGGRRSASASVQFQMADEDWTASAEVKQHVEGTTAETEAWFADLWHRMGWGYYEVDNVDEPAANVPSPTTQSAGA